MAEPRQVPSATTPIFRRPITRGALAVVKRPAPTVTINQAIGQTDPAYVGPILFDVVFSEAVTGFTASDVVISGTAGATVRFMTGSGANYQVSVIMADSLGVTINRVLPDPTTLSPIVFNVVFTEPVTGFATGDVSFAGSTVTGALVGVVAGSGQTYTVTVTGMASSGNVVATIPAGVATSTASGLTNDESTSTDNSVFFCFPTLAVFDTYDRDLYVQPERAVYDAATGYMYIQSLWRPFTTGLIKVIDVSVPEIVATLADTRVWNTWYAFNKKGDYLYVGTGIGTPPTMFTVVDVSDPLNPTIVASLSDASFNSNFLAIDFYGNYAIAVVATNRFAVIDISDPTDPVLVSMTIDATNLPAGPLAMLVVGNYVYFTAMSNDPPVPIYNLTNPAAPVFVGSIEGQIEQATDLLRDGDIVWCGSSSITSLDVTNPAAPYEVGWKGMPLHSFSPGRLSKSGTKMVFQSASRITLLDMTNAPRQMTVISTLTGSQLNNTTPRGVDFDGTWAYVLTDFNFTTVNFTNPAVPTFGSTTVLNGAFGFHRSGNFIYIAYGPSDQLRIYDRVTTPGAISLTGSLTDATGLDEVFDCAVSGSHCYLVSQVAGGRFAVVNVSTPSAPTLTASVTGTNFGPAYKIVVSGNYAYLYRADGFLAVVNITTPSTPTFVTALNTGSTAFVYSMVRSGTTLYLAQSDPADRILAIDISTPTAPFIANTSGLPDGVGLLVDGNTLYATSSQEDGATLTAIDISTSVMRPIGHVPGDSVNRFWFPWLDKLGDILYVNNTAFQLMVTVDVSDPDHPFAIDTSGTDPTTYSQGDVGFGVDANGIYIAGGQTFLKLDDPSFDVVARLGDSTSGVEYSQLVGTTLYTLSTGTRLAAINVSDPHNPVDLWTASSSLFGGSSTALCVLGTKAYARTSDGTIAVADLSTSPPSFIAETGAITALSNSDGAMVGSGTRLYSRGATWFAVIDISTPAAPTVVGSINDATNLDGTFGNPCLVYDAPYVYTVADAVDRFLVIDVSTPTAPVIVGNIQNGTTLDGATTIIKEGNLCYVGCSSRVTIVNVATPTAPTIVGSVLSAQLGEVSGLVKSGNYVYCANRASSVDRVTVVNVTTPASPTIRSFLIADNVVDQGRGIHLVGSTLLIPCGGNQYGWLSIVDGVCV